MLDAASALDNLHIRPKTKGQNAEDDAETLEAFEQRLQTFVQLNLLRASGSRDNYKHGLVYQARKDLIQQILKASLMKRCQKPGCGA
jgi:DNA-directed RNA polymerase I subunit RPA1